VPDLNLCIPATGLPTIRSGGRCVARVDRSDASCARSRSASIHFVWAGDQPGKGDASVASGQARKRASSAQQPERPAGENVVTNRSIDEWSMARHLERTRQWLRSVSAIVVGELAAKGVKGEVG